MEITNLSGLEKPLTKLIEVVAEGIGETANTIFELDAKKIKRIGTAEAEAEKERIVKKAEGQASAVEILNRANSRFALEQYNKQINLENIIVKARVELEGTIVSDEPVEKDWSMRFMGIAQDVSKEEIQNLLAKILAGEVKQPGQFSLKTLDIIKNISKNSLSLFRKMSIISDDNQLVYVTKSNTNDGFFEFSFIELLKLSEVGLIQNNLAIVLKLKNMKAGEKFKISLKNKDIFFKISKSIDYLPLPEIVFTEAGREISTLFNIEQNDEVYIDTYLEELNKFWSTKNIEIIPL